MTTIHRRQFIRQGAALAAAGLAGPLGAQAPAPFTPPTVDALTIRVLTDSSYDTPRTGSHPMVKVQRAGLASPRDFRKTLHNEWGLALALESRAGTDTRKMLLDFGYTPEALLNNMELVGVKPEEQRALIVSHGHFDHWGGLIGFLQKHRERLPADLVLYTGGEEVFCERKSGTGTAGHFSDFGVLDRRELAALKVKVVTCEQPRVIDAHAFSTGPIARRSFERVLPNTFVVYGMKDGVGCDMPAEAARANGQPQPDQHLHEHATVFQVKDRGLVVITSCGHAGIVNTARQAMEVSGVRKLHALVGGMHLFPAQDDYLMKTVEEMKALAPDVVIPLHCSGPGFIQAMRSQWGDRLLTSTTGTSFTFGA